MGAERQRWNKISKQSVIRVGGEECVGAGGVGSRPKVYGDPAGGCWGMRNRWGCTEVALQSVVRVNDHRNTAGALILKLGHK